MQKNIHILLTINIFIAAFVFPHFSWGQENIYFKTYSTTEGLPSGTINEIWKDKKGFLWLLSENTLTRFDGYDFVTYRNKANDSTSISSASVYKAVSDSAGNTFFQTYNSISKYNYSTGKFKQILKFSAYTDISSFGSRNRIIYCIYNKQLLLIDGITDKESRYKLPESLISKGRIFVYATNSSFFLFNNNVAYKFNLRTFQFEEILIKTIDGVNHLTQDIGNSYFFEMDNTIYISEPGHLYKLNFEGNSFIEVAGRDAELNPGRLKRTNDRQIKNFIIKSDGSGEIGRIDLINGTYQSLDLKKDPLSGIKSNGEITGVFQGDQHTIWVTGYHSGLISIDLEKFTLENVRYYNKKNSNITSENCNAIFDGKDNVIWFFSPSNGLIKGEKIRHVFKTINPEPEINFKVPTNAKNIRAILETQPGTITIGSLSRLNQLDIKNPYSGFENSRLLLQSPISCITIDQDSNLWLGTWGKRSIYRLNLKTNAITPIISDSSKFVFNDRFFRCVHKENNKLYFGASGGYLLEITHYPSEQRKFETSFIPLNPKGQNTSTIFTIISFDKDKLLIGSASGLFIYDKNLKNISPIKNIFPSSAIFNNADVRSLIIDQNTLWVGTNGNGLYQFNLKSGAVTNFTTDDGLPDNSIYTMIFDKQKNIWMGTNKGISKIDSQTSTIQAFSFKDGISFDEFNTNAVCSLTDGRLAFGGINGLIVFSPDSVSGNIVNPIPEIIRFSVNNTEFPLASNYHLKHYENYISFQFAALNNYRNDEIQYAYKLEGLDENWNYCGKRRFSTYANLKPGKYTLKIKCTNQHGIWSNNELSISFKIEVPWFKSWIFFGSIFIFTSIAIFGLFRFRLQQKTKLLTIRDSIARDLHDEIGSNLSTISIFNEVAKESIHKNKEGILPVLDKISEYTQISQEAMSDIVWMIDSKNDKFENIIVKMRTLAAETIGTTSSMKLHLNFDENAKSLKIGMKQRKNLYMIYKESINNIIKYANCKNVWIDLVVNEHLVKLIISDDGQGFDPKNASGNGLIYMKKRAEELEAMFNVDSIIGKGTSVTLEFRL
jgi:ligand-binding sensor domain-containing protein